MDKIEKFDNAENQEEPAETLEEMKQSFKDLRCGIAELIKKCDDWNTGMSLQTVMIALIDYSENELRIAEFPPFVPDNMRDTMLVLQICSDQLFEILGSAIRKLPKEYRKKIGDMIGL